MNLTPSFNLWEVAAGVAIGAGIIAGTGWTPVSVMLGAAIVAIFTAIRGKQWPVALAVIFGLWAYNAVVLPILPQEATPSGVLQGVESVTGDLGREARQAGS